MALVEHYVEPVENTFDFTGAADIYDSPTSSSYRAPDASITVASQIPPVDPSKERLPFLVLESAICQSSQSLKEKVNFWLLRKISYVIAVDRVPYEQTSESAKDQGHIDISVYGPKEYFQSVRISFGQRKTFEFVLSKAVIGEGYDLSAYVLHPEADEIKVKLLQYFAK